MEAERRALIVATSRHKDPFFRTLRAPRHDAAAMMDVLAAPDVGNFDAQPLLDKPHYVVQEHIERLFDAARPDDRLLMYVSGHGYVDDHGRLYFIMRNSRQELLQSTAISDEWLKTVMRSSRAEREVLQQPRLCP
jgi:Caspase domain